MEDFLMIHTGFMRGIVNKVINKMLAKQNLGVHVDVGNASVSWSEKNQKATIHLDVNAELSKEDIIDILGKAGVL